MDKRIFLLFFISLALSFLTYQYVVSLGFVLANAAKPLNGHFWSEMECSAGLCIIGNNNVGIGTSEPLTKLQVEGNIKASGTICDGDNNCIEEAASGDSGKCGPAATTYPESANDFVGVLCDTGTPSPASLSLPSAGNSVNWSCLGTSGGGSASCTAFKSTGAYLIGGIHTQKNCLDATGQVIPASSGSTQCKFINASSCPAGWHQYLFWSKTTACATPGVETWCRAYGAAQCITGSHDFSNQAVEACTGTNCSGFNVVAIPCTAYITQIGCF